MENWKQKLGIIWTLLWAFAVIVASAGTFNYAYATGEWFYALAGAATLGINAYIILKSILKK